MACFFCTRIACILRNGVNLTPVIAAISVVSYHPLPPSETSTEPRSCHNSCSRATSPASAEGSMNLPGCLPPSVRRIHLVTSPPPPAVWRAAPGSLRGHTSAAVTIRFNVRPGAGPEATAARQLCDQNQRRGQPPVNLRLQ